MEGLEFSKMGVHGLWWTGVKRTSFTGMTGYTVAEEVRLGHTE